MDEEGSLVVGGRIGFEAASEIGGEASGGEFGEGDDAFFVELGIPEGECIFLEIDVAKAKADALAEAEGAGVEQVEESDEGMSEEG